MNEQKSSKKNLGRNDKSILNFITSISANRDINKSSSKDSNKPDQMQVHCTLKGLIKGTELHSSSLHHALWYKIEKCKEAKSEENSVMSNFSQV